MQTKLLLSTLCFCLFTLSGCATSLTMPQSLEEQLGSPLMGETATPKTDWWQVYGDEQLNNLIQEARNNNTNLARSAISINKALYQANKLGANLLPSFSASGETSGRQNTADGSPSSSQLTSNLSLSYELDIWRKLADSATAQEWEYKATTWDLEAVWLTLANNVADSYFNLAYLETARQLAENNVENYTKIHNLVQSRYLAGKVDALEAAQATQSLLDAQNQLLDLQKQTVQEEEILRNLLNKRPDEPLNLQLAHVLPNSIPQAVPSLDVPLSVLAGRPDLRAAESRVYKTLYNAQAAQKKLYPSITLGAAVQTTASTAQNIFQVPVISGLISISLPFLDWPTLRWDIKTSEADFEDAKLAFEQSITTALNEVNTLFTAYQNAAQALALAQEKVENSRVISQYQQDRYQSGAAEFSDYLQALTSQNTAERALQQQYATVLTSANAVFKAMAGKVEYTRPE